MSAIEDLKPLGWFLSEEGLDIVSENGEIKDTKSLVKKALDYDLRDISSGSFPEDFTKDPSTLEQAIVVQIQKIRNVTAPKANEESHTAPRMLKFTLHDGKATCNAIESSHIPSFSINTPPGTKILLKNEELEAHHGVLWLTADNMSVLGGKVQHMIEKWELNRSLAKHKRGGGDGETAPPPWIPFGRPLESHSIDTTFKSIQETAKQDNAEFQAQRLGAIAEAQAMSGVKKVFGGGTKTLMDANVQKIIDAGFTEEQAEQALKYAKNNVDRALKNLQKREQAESSKKEKTTESAPKKKGRHKEEDDSSHVKPTGKVSLFDFLEDKLPNMPKEKPSRPQQGPSNENRNNFNKDKSNFKPRNHEQPNKFNQRNQHKNDNQFHKNNQQFQEKPPRFQRKEADLKRQQNFQGTSEMYSSNFGGPQKYNNKTDQQYYTNNSVNNLTNAASQMSISQPPNIPPFPGNSLRESNYNPGTNYMSNSYNQSGSHSSNSALTYRRDQNSYPDSSRRNGYTSQEPQQPFKGYMNQGGYNNYSNYQNRDFGPSKGQVRDQRVQQPVSAPQSQWRVGERCLALYWEDNNYYEAEITGLSENTAVVKFSAYGNHEEVLKSNVLPFPNGQAPPPPPRNRPTQQVYAPPGRRI